jgi:hypothetical protein
VTRPIELPGVGPLVQDEDGAWSELVAIPALGGFSCRFVLPIDYDTEPEPGCYHAAVANLPSASVSMLADASDEVLRFYEDVVRHEPAHAQAGIRRAEDVWRHVTLGEEVWARRHRTGGPVYLSVGCECDWEPEHGLLLVIEDGRRVTRVSMHDGHDTWEDACAEPAFRGRVYVSSGEVLAAYAARGR